MLKKSFVIFSIMVLAISFVIAEEPNCYDNDGGKNYSVYGVMANESGFFGDFCQEDGLFEYYCEDDSGKVINVICLEGCSEGECVNGSVQECEIQSCNELGFECGMQDDGCNGTLDCGSCSEGSVCEEGTCVFDGGSGGGGGGGIDGGIGECIPVSCDYHGAECGSLWDDGCNGTLDCGSCSEGSVCEEGTCVVIGSGSSDEPSGGSTPGSVESEEGLGLWWILVGLGVAALIGMVILFIIKMKSISSVSGISGATMAGTGAPKPPSNPSNLAENGEVPPKSDAQQGTEKKQEISKGFEIRN